MEMSKNTRNDQSEKSQTPSQQPQMPPVVRYDSACSLCTMLAQLAGKRVSTSQMLFLPSEKVTPEKLEIEFSENEEKKILAGENAWLWLLEHHPDLDEIHWIAQKMGIAAPTSRYMMRGAEILKRFCFRCR